VLRTTPVGAYPTGASPEGIHDLSGNVWEWTVSLYQPYPYRPDDGREDPQAEGPRVVRGGSWLSPQWYARCAFRGRGHPDGFYFGLGFRVVVSLADSGF
jgi:formylglycine-generating enzyme required for sulfatase activity